MKSQITSTKPQIPGKFLFELGTLGLGLATFLLALPCTAQPPVEWETTFSRSEYDRPYDITSNSMEEYVVCGCTFNKEGDHYDGIIIKFDFKGNKIWEKMYGYGNTEILTSLVTVPSGGYVAAGYTASKGAGASDFWIIKVSETGELIWEKTFGDKYEDKARDVLLTGEGEIIVTGSQMTESSSTIEMWVMKLSPDGEMIWNKRYGGHHRCYGEGVAAINDQYIIAGYFEPLSSSNDKYSDDKARIIAVDRNGNLLWEKIYGGEKEDQASDIIVTSGKEIFVTGNTESKGTGYEDMWTMKLNVKGEMIWDQTFGDISSDGATSLTASEEGIVICGNTSSRESNSNDIAVVSYNRDGKFLWSTSLKTELNESQCSIISTSDGGYVVTAESCGHYQYDSKPVKCKMKIIKFSGTPVKSVQNYVNLKVKNWEKKGEFEKTEAYQKRVNEENRKKIIEKHTREAIAYYAGQNIDFTKATIGDYDADAEEFSINIKELGNLKVKVPIDGAQTFKESWNNVQFENPEFLLVVSSFVIQKVTMVIGGKEYSFGTPKAPDKFILTGERQQTGQDVFRGSGDPLKGLNVSKASSEIKIGKYFALVIGVDNYKGQWTPLNNAVRDAQAIELLLKAKYRFDQFKTLYDEQATRVNIINALMWFAENTTENDNVFIYYSGHGDFNKQLNKGYWVPADAQTASVASYISNADIQTFLNGINSKHTLLVSDACFSGDIFRGSSYKVSMDSPEKYFAQAYNLKSRQALTSGGVEPVMDGGRDGHSVFAYYFLNVLRSNENFYLDASQLFDKIKVPITNNSSQTPNLQPVKDTGDEGGQFIFMRK